MATNVKNGAIVVSCSCTHKYQDDTYGKGRRLANLTIKGSRCTVCGFNHIQKVDKPETKA